MESKDLDRQNDEDFIVLSQLSQEEQIRLESQHRERLQIFYSATKKYAIESWYNSLQQYTFKSFFFMITNIQAYYLSILYHEDTFQLDKQKMKDTGLSLTRKVDKFLHQNFPLGCFMKLSTRSPKDRSWDYRDVSIKEYHIQKLLKRLQGKFKQLDKSMLNNIYRYFLQQSKDQLKITSGQDFINIFSRSDRIQIDINDMAYIRNNLFGRFSQDDYQHSDEPFIGVWGRQWVSCSWMEEFRCFYNNYTLTAITQYDQRCYFEELQSKQSFIKEKVQIFFQKLKPQLKKLQLNQGVMDLIVRLDNNNDPILIEINIFDHNSRGSLFSWEQDRQIIEQGPTTVRILKEEKAISKWQLTKMMGMIQKGIDTILQQVMKKLGLQQQWKILD